MINTSQSACTYHRDTNHIFILLLDDRACVSVRVGLLVCECVCTIMAMFKMRLYVLVCAHRIEVN